MNCMEEKLPFLFQGNNPLVEHADRPSGPGGVARSAGVVVQARYFSNLNHHPVSGFLWLLSQCFLKAGATPPGQEGQLLHPSVKYVIGAGGELPFRAYRLIHD
jgi:hypothetical protein